jgi:hypothetical protein
MSCEGPHGEGLDAGGRARGPRSKARALIRGMKSAPATASPSSRMALMRCKSSTSAWVWSSRKALSTLPRRNIALGIALDDRGAPSLMLAPRTSRDRADHQQPLGAETQRRRDGRILPKPAVAVELAANLHGRKHQRNGRAGQGVLRGPPSRAAPPRGARGCSAGPRPARGRRRASCGPWKSPWRSR